MGIAECAFRRVIGHGSIHQERLEFVPFFQRRFEHHSLLFKLLAKSGTVPDAFAHELALHSAFVLEQKLLPAVVVQVDSSTITANGSQSLGFSPNGM